MHYLPHDHEHPHDYDEPGGPDEPVGPGLFEARRAPIDVKDQSFGGTPLSWALYGWYERSPGAERDRYCDVVALLMRAGAMAPQRWFEEPPRDDFVGQLQADRRMLAALGGHP